MPREVRNTVGELAYRVLINPRLKTFTLYCTRPYDDTLRYKGYEHLLEHVGFGRAVPRLVRFPVELAHGANEQERVKHAHNLNLKGFSLFDALPGNAGVNAHTDSRDVGYHITVDASDLDAPRRVLKAYELFITNQDYMFERAISKSTWLEYQICMLELELRRDGNADAARCMINCIGANQFACSRSAGDVGGDRSFLDKPYDEAGMVKLIKEHNFNADVMIQCPQWTPELKRMVESTLQNVQRRFSQKMSRVGRNGPLISPDLDLDNPIYFERACGQACRSQRLVGERSTLVGVSALTGPVGSPHADAVDVLAHHIAKPNTELQRKLKDVGVEQINVSQLGKPAGNMVVMLMLPNSRFSPASVPAALKLMRDTAADWFDDAANEVAASREQALHSTDPQTLIDFHERAYQAGLPVTQTRVSGKVAHLGDVLGVCETHSHMCVMEPRNEADLQNDLNLLNILKFAERPPLELTRSGEFSTPSDAAERGQAVHMLFEVPNRARHKALNDATVTCMMSYLQQTNLQQEGIAATWLSNVDGVSLHVDMGHNCNTSLADACALIRRAACDGSGADGGLFQANMQRILSQCMMEANMPQATCVNLVRAAAWKDDSPLYAQSPAEYASALRDIEPESIRQHMSHIAHAPVHVTCLNTGDREALAIQHMFNATSEPRAQLCDCINTGKGPRSLRRLRDTSDDVMRHYCAMLPLRADLTDQQCEVARVATNVIGLGFNGQLMKKLRLDMQACYSAGAYFDGGLLHQPLICVQSAFGKCKCDAAVRAVEKIMHDWASGEITPQELRMAQQARLSDARMRTPEQLFKWRSQCLAAGKDPQALDDTMQKVCSMNHAEFVRHLDDAVDMQHFTQALST